MIRFGNLSRPRFCLVSFLGRSWRFFPQQSVFAFASIMLLQGAVKEETLIDGALSED